MYSPGRSRKKNAIAIMSATAIVIAAWEAMARCRTRCKTQTGIGLTRLGGGSCLPHAFQVRCKRKSMFPNEFSRGSGAPTVAIS